MIDRSHRLSIIRQARELGISRGSVYYLPRAVSSSDLALQRRIDELHLNYPFAGARMLQGLLIGEGHKVGRLHVSSSQAVAQTANICLRDEANGHCSDLSTAKHLQACAIVIRYGSRSAILWTQNLSVFAA